MALSENLEGLTVFKVSRKKRAAKDQVVQTTELAMREKREARLTSLVSESALLESRLEAASLRSMENPEGTEEVFEEILENSVADGNSILTPTFGSLDEEATRLLLKVRKSQLAAEIAIEESMDSKDPGQQEVFEYAQTTLKETKFLDEMLFQLESIQDLIKAIRTEQLPEQIFFKSLEERSRLLDNLELVVWFYKNQVSKALSEEPLDKELIQNVREHYQRHAKYLPLIENFSPVQDRSDPLLMALRDKQELATEANLGVFFGGQLPPILESPHGAARSNVAESVHTGPEVSVSSLQPSEIDFFEEMRKSKADAENTISDFEQQEGKIQNDPASQEKLENAREFIRRSPLLEEMLLQWEGIQKFVSKTQQEQQQENDFFETPEQREQLIEKLNRIVWFYKSQFTKALSNDKIIENLISRFNHQCNRYTKLRSVPYFSDRENGDDILDKILKRLLEQAVVPEVSQETQNIATAAPEVEEAKGSEESKEAWEIEEAQGVEASEETSQDPNVTDAQPVLHNFGQQAYHKSSVFFPNDSPESSQVRVPWIWESNDNSKRSSVARTEPEENFAPPPPSPAFSSSDAHESSSLPGLSPSTIAIEDWRTKFDKLASQMAKAEKDLEVREAAISEKENDLWAREAAVAREEAQIARSAAKVSEERSDKQETALKPNLRRYFLEVSKELQKEKTNRLTLNWYNPIALKSAAKRIKRMEQIKKAYAEECAVIDQLNLDTVDNLPFLKKKQSEHFGKFTEFREKYKKEKTNPISMAKSKFFSKSRSSKSEIREVIRQQADLVLFYKELIGKRTKAQSNKDRVSHHHPVRDSWRIPSEYQLNGMSNQRSLVTSARFQPRTSGESTPKVSAGKRTNRTLRTRR